MCKYLGKSRIHKKAVSLFGSDVPIMKYCYYSRYRGSEWFDFSNDDYSVRIYVCKSYYRILKSFYDENDNKVELFNESFPIISF